MIREPLPERDDLLAALVRHRWVIADAARELGASRQGIYKAMKRYRIRRRPQTKSVFREMRVRGANAKHGKREPVSD